MFANDIVLADAAAANKTFKLIELDGSSSERIDTTSTRANPRVLRIKRTNGSGKNATDRYLVQFAKNVQGTVGPIAAVVNVSIALPQDTALSQADVLDLVAFMKNFLSTTNVQGLLLGDI